MPTATEAPTAVDDAPGPAPAPVPRSPTGSDTSSDSGPLVGFGHTQAPVIVRERVGGDRSSSSDDDAAAGGGTPEDRARAEMLRSVAAMADMYIRSAAVRQGLVLRSYLCCVVAMRPQLVGLLFVSSITAVVCIIGTLQSDFSHCCVPSACDNIAGLNGTLPGFTLPGRVCLLTPEQASGLQCPQPQLTSELLNNNTCARMTSKCPSPYYGTALIIGVGCVSIFVACVALILPTMYATVLNVLLSWVFVLAAGLLSVILVAVGGGVINSVNGGLNDDGVQTNSNDQGIQFPTGCFNQSFARGITNVHLNSGIAQGQFFAYGCVIFGAVTTLMLPCMWISRYRKMRADLRRQAILHILGDDED
jgi:hypothetical protein